MLYLVYETLRTSFLALNLRLFFTTLFSSFLLLVAKALVVAVVSLPVSVLSVRVLFGAWASIAFDILVYCTAIGVFWEAFDEVIPTSKEVLNLPLGIVLVAWKDLCRACILFSSVFLCSEAIKLLLFVKEGSFVSSLRTTAALLLCVRADLVVGGWTEEESVAPARTDLLLFAGLVTGVVIDVDF